MTDQKEIRSLIARAEAKGAVVTVKIDQSALETEGREIIEEVQVVGLKGVGRYPMSLISAAERLREALA
jgi:hypothetical protein